MERNKSEPYYELICEDFDIRDAKVDYGRRFFDEKEIEQYAREISDGRYIYEYLEGLISGCIVRTPTGFRRILDRIHRMITGHETIVGTLDYVIPPLDIDTVCDDPLPPHEPDGYWSGYKGEGEMDLSEYAEDDGIPALAVRFAKYPVNIRTNSGRDIDILDDDMMSRYIRNVAVIGLIDKDGDNYIRYILLNSHVKRIADYVGMMVCRCGDCGKRA